jgi:hypothetical protein
MDFHETWYLSIFEKSFEKVKIFLKGEKNDGQFTWRPLYTFDHFSNSYSDNENCFIGNITARILRSVIFFSNILPFTK